MRVLLHTLRVHLARCLELRTISVEYGERHLYGPEKERGVIEIGIETLIDTRSSAAVNGRRRRRRIAVQACVAIVLLSVQYIVRLSAR